MWEKKDEVVKKEGNKKEKEDGTEEDRTKGQG